MKTRKLTVIFIILILSVLPLSSCGDPSNEANVPLIPAEVLVHPTSELITSEEGATDSFSVVLGKVPAGVVTIGVVSEDESEVIADKASLEFTNENWETPQTVTLTGVDDEKADANQLVTIFIAVDSAPSDPDFAALDPADVSVTNLDNDEAGVTVIPAAGHITSENGTTSTFNVVLNTAPEGNVVIDLASGNTSEVTVDKTSLIFTQEQWQQPQTVTITGVDDYLADGDVQVVIALTINQRETIATTGYAQLDPQDVSVTNQDNDQLGITVTPTLGHITSEGGTTSTFEVVLTTAPDGNVVIDLTSGNTSEVRLDQSSLTFTPEQWQQPQTVTIAGVDDSMADGDANVLIALTVNQGETADSTGYAAQDPDDVLVVNQDNDEAGITVTPTLGHMTSEGATTSTFEVALATAPNGNVVIDLASGNTSEVTLDKVSLIFTPEQWQQPQTVTIAGVDDSMADGDANVLIALTVNQGETTDSTGYDALDPDDVLVVNQDNDEAGITVTPTLGHITSEGATTSTFEVALATAPNGNVVIDLASGNTSEVTLDQSSLIFTPGQWQDTQTVTITGVDDSMADGDAEVLIALTVNQGDTTDSTGYAALDPDDVSVINQDNDEAGITVTPTLGHMTSEGATTSTFEVALATAPNGNVVIDLASGNTSEVTLDQSSLIFTPEQWQDTQTVTITGVDDYLADGDVEVLIALTVNQGETTDSTGYAALDPADVTATNQDNDQLGITVTPTQGHITSEGVTTSTFEVVLTTAPDGNVVIDLASGNSNEVTLDQSSLIFTPDQWQQAQMVTITGVDDNMADGDAEVLIALTVNQTDTTDSTGYAALDPDDVSVINQDNDEAGITVTPVSGLITSEGATASSFNVALATAPNGNVVIDLASGNTDEITLDQTSLIFTPEQWQETQTVTITGVDDYLADGDADVLIALTVNQTDTTDSTGYAALDPDDVLATNQDNDVIGVTVTPVLGLVTSESATTATFSVALTTAPDGNVVIDLASGNIAEVTLDKTTLVFPPGQWQQSQTVTITGVNDSLADGDIEVLIALTINQTDTTDSTGYAGLDPDDVLVTNLDNEAQPEGTPDEPRDITSTIPSEGSVGAASSYYVISGLTETLDYIVSISTVSEDLLLYVYPDNTNIGDIDTRPTGSELCFSNNFQDARPESCIATATATGQFFIVVDVATGISDGATYTIDVSGAPVSEGIVGDPLDITPMLPDFLGGFNGGVPSYYKVTGLTPLTVYRVELGHLTANGDLDVYSDATFATGVRLCGASVSSIAETCEAGSNSAGELYIKASNRTSPAATDVSFYVNVMAPLSNEGDAAAPQNLTGLLPYEGMVKTAAGSFYKVTGLVANATYSVGLINMAGQAALEVYPDDTYTSDSCRSDQSGNWPEYCDAVADSTGSLYFMAVPGTNFSTAGATFRVVVK